jgi:hypothetical protein
MDKKEIYCGNNRLNEKLVNGDQELGTRYECLRKGIGKGLNLAVDLSYQEYEPIDDRKIYCGNKEELPYEYDYHGTLPMCLQKGIGIGKHLRVLRYLDEMNELESIDNDNISVVDSIDNDNISVVDSVGFFRRNIRIIKFITIILIISITLFLILYLLKPSFIIKKENDRENIDWRNFIILYSIIMIIFILLIWKIIY